MSTVLIEVPSDFLEKIAALTESVAALTERIQIKEQVEGNPWQSKNQFAVRFRKSYSTIDNLVKRGLVERRTGLGKNPEVRWTTEAWEQACALGQ